MNYESPGSGRTEFEVGLQRILAYIGEKRYRRRIAYAVAFLVIFAAIETLFSLIFALLTIALTIVSLPVINSIFPNSVMFGLAATAITRALPFVITLLIFTRLSKIYGTR